MYISIFLDASYLNYLYCILLKSQVVTRYEIMLRDYHNSEIFFEKKKQHRKYKTKKQIHISFDIYAQKQDAKRLTSILNVKFLSSLIN